MTKRFICLLLSAVTVMSSLVFSACKQENSEFSFEKLDSGGYQVTSYTGSDEVVRIPHQYNGEAVVAIGDEAFKDNKTIKILSNGGTIYSIGDRAFSGCSALETVFISADTAYVGENAFEGCSSVEINCEAETPAQSMLWDINWNPDNASVIWNSRQGDDSSPFAVIKDLASQTLSKCKSSAATYCLNTVMNYLGIGGDDKYQKEFEEIKKDISNLSQQVSKLENQLGSIERNMLTAVDRSELGSRMTTINQYIIKINSIYKDYELMSSSADEKERSAFAKIISKSVEEADIPYMLEYINSELTGTGGGTQTPILTLYRTYLEKVYPLKHESGAIENYFYEYMSGIQTQATILYTAYCNYKQEENSDESAAYGKKCESFLEQSKEYLKTQKSMVTKEEDYKHIVNTVTNGNRTYTEYRLISNLNGKTIYFSDFIVDDSFLLREKNELVGEEWSGYDYEPVYKTCYEEISLIKDTGSLYDRDFTEFFKTKETYHESGTANTNFLIHHMGKNFQTNTSYAKILCLAKKHNNDEAESQLGAVFCNSPGEYVSNEYGTGNCWMICWSNDQTRPAALLDKIYSYFGNQ